MAYLEARSSHSRICSPHPNPQVAQAPALHRVCALNRHIFARPALLEGAARVILRSSWLDFALFCASLVESSDSLWICSAETLQCITRHRAGFRHIGVEKQRLMGQLVRMLLM